MAARNGHLEMCTLLCEAGASLKATNNSGRTALLEACQFHQSHVIPYLREIARRKKAERDAIRLKKQEEGGGIGDGGSSVGGGTTTLGELTDDEDDDI
jgi:hypothetical protein